MTYTITPNGPIEVLREELTRFIEDVMDRPLPLPEDDEDVRAFARKLVTDSNSGLKPITRRH